MYYVYILRSETTNTFYIGCTDNIDRRIKEHNAGLSKYTKAKRPWIIEYKEEYNTLSEARSRERKIKSWKKREAIKKLIHGPIV